MATREAMAGPRRDELMMEIQAKCAAGRQESISPRALEIFDEIDDLAFGCAGARNAGLEHYLSCTECPITHRLWEQAWEQAISQAIPRGRPRSSRRTRPGQVSLLGLVDGEAV